MPNVAFIISAEHDASPEQRTLQDTSEKQLVVSKNTNSFEHVHYHLKPLSGSETKDSVSHWPQRKYKFAITSFMER